MENVAPPPAKHTPYLPADRQDFALILDEYQVIETQAIDRAMALLL
jgi:hypothetical protein